MRQYNLPLLQKVRTVGRYDMPMLAKQDVTTPDTLMGFNYATGKKTVKHCGIHFFIDDYQFQRVWNQPDRYIAPLKRFQCVLTPDFSTYMDMPSDRSILAVLRAESHPNASMGWPRIVLLLLFRHSKQLHRRGKHCRSE